MAYFLSEPAPGACDLTAKNRVWGFFAKPNNSHPVNRRNPQQLRQKNRPTPTKTVSGIPLWPSRDPIEETGGINLYVSCRNHLVNSIDLLGKDAVIFIPPGGTNAGIYNDAMQQYLNRQNSNNISTIPNVYEHLGLMDIGDQTPYFDAHFPKTTEIAKGRIKELISSTALLDICRRNNASKTYGGQVVLSIYPNSFTAPWVSADLRPPNPLTGIIMDNAYDAGQSFWEASAELGKFWYRLAPQTVYFIIESSSPDKKVVHYSAKMELRDSIGPNIGFNYKATRASWTVEGKIECKCKPQN